MASSNPLRHNYRPDQFLYSYSSLSSFETQKSVALVSYRDHEFCHDHFASRNLAVLPHRHKLVPVEVCSKITGFAPGTQFLVSVVRVVDVELGSSASWTRLIGKIIHACQSPKALKLSKWRPLVVRWVSKYTDAGSSSIVDASLITESSLIPSLVEITPLSSFDICRSTDRKSRITSCPTECKSGVCCLQTTGEVCMLLSRGPFPGHDVGHRFSHIRSMVCNPFQVS
jgi:hypothetical protein